MIPDDTTAVPLNAHQIEAARDIRDRLEAFGDLVVSVPAGIGKTGARIIGPTSSAVNHEQLMGRCDRDGAGEVPVASVAASKRAVVRAAQKAARSARFAQRDAHRTSALYESEGGELPGERPSDPTRGPRGTHCATPFVTRTVRASNHPRRDKGYRRRKRAEAVKQQEAANERIAANQLRLAGLRAKGEPLPGQRPNPATVRK